LAGELLIDAATLHTVLAEPFEVSGWPAFDSGAGHSQRLLLSVIDFC